jgi:hypothetical protein
MTDALHNVTVMQLRVALRAIVRSLDAVVAIALGDARSELLTEVAEKARLRIEIGKELHSNLAGYGGPAATAMADALERLDRVYGTFERTAGAGRTVAALALRRAVADVVAGSGAWG